MNIIPPCCIIVCRILSLSFAMNRLLALTAGLMLYPVLHMHRTHIPGYITDLHMPMIRRPRRLSGGAPAAPRDSMDMSYTSSRCHTTPENGSRRHCIGQTIYNVCAIIRFHDIINYFEIMICRCLFCLLHHDITIKFHRPASFSTEKRSC